MITYADKLIAKSKYPSLSEKEALKEYYLDNLIMWNNTLESLSQNQSYKISNGQNSSRDLERVTIEDAQNQVNKWTEKLENLTGSSITKPIFSTIQTHGNYPC